MRIFKTRAFDKFARKNDICNSMLVEAVERAENGLIDANLGNGVLKQRIARVGQGRSKGHRTIILFRKEERTFFVYGFSKNDRENLRQDEEEKFRKMADYYLSLPEKDVSMYLAKGDFKEVNRNG